MSASHRPRAFEIDRQHVVEADMSTPMAVARHIHDVCAPNMPQWSLTSTLVEQRMVTASAAVQR